MRLKLVLKIVEGTVLPCNYMYELSSCLYKVLNEGNPVFTAWLHDKGYCKEKKVSLIPQHILLEINLKY